MKHINMSNVAIGLEQASKHYVATEHRDGFIVQWPFQYEKDGKTWGTIGQVDFSCMCGECGDGVNAETMEEKRKHARIANVGQKDNFLRFLQGLGYEDGGGK